MSIVSVSTATAAARISTAGIPAAPEIAASMAAVTAAVPAPVAAVMMIRGMIPVVVAMMMAGAAVSVRVRMNFVAAVFVEASRIGSRTCDEIMIPRVRTGSIAVIFVPGITIASINSHHRNEYNCYYEY